jgi:Rieske Fe-S protein
MRTRREFIFGVGKATGAAALGYIALPILQSCLPTSAPLVPAPTSIPIASDGTISVNVSTLIQANPELAVADFIGDDGFGVIVTLTPDGIYHAFSRRCTHQFCPVDDFLTSGKIRCNCHGSLFNLDGSVNQGPAATPLASYPVTPPVSGSSIAKIKVR